VTIIWNIILEKGRQQKLAQTRPPLDSGEFTRRLIESGIQQRVAQFVWDEFQPYYFAPLTPYPDDRPISEFKIDSDDLSDIVASFEKRFDRRWNGKWIGSDDPTLTEFASGLMASTGEN
jgi:hypothetical protein